MWHLLEIVQEKINTLKRKVIVKNLPILPSHRFYNIISLNKKSILVPCDMFQELRIWKEKRETYKNCVP